MIILTFFQCVMLDTGEKVLAQALSRDDKLYFYKSQMALKFQQAKLYCKDFEPSIDDNSLHDYSLTYEKNMKTLCDQIRNLLSNNDKPVLPKKFLLIIEALNDLFYAYCELSAPKSSIRL